MNTGVEKNGTPLSAAFLIPRRKVRLTPTARVPCSNIASIEKKEKMKEDSNHSCKI